MKYEVSIKTGDQYKAGTDSNIFLILEGENGQSEERRLNGYISRNAFERNNLDKVVIDFGADVGRVFRIKLRSDMMYAGAGWLLSYIEVKKEGGGSQISKFNINQWIEDKRTHSFEVPYEEWAENIVSYETVIKEYKVYPITVPANGNYSYEQMEKTTTGFTYSNTTTKSSTAEFNESLKLNGSYTQNAKAAKGLSNTKNYAGYLEFAFKQGFASSEINEVVSSENKEISKKVQANLTNPDSHEKKYEAVFSLVKVNAIASTGGVVAMFSANMSIEFSGFREVTN